MLIGAALGFINHLLASEQWARDRLKAFAGKTARLELGALGLPLEITPDGLFAAGAKDAVTSVTPSVIITLPADAPLRVVTDRASVFAAAQISGSAELAESLGFVFRNLRWDVESDLAQLFGDIAARRLVAGGTQLLAWQQQQAMNLARNVAEYCTEENPTIARRRDVWAFCAEVGGLQETLTKLESRIAALER
jgi:ubiquinone biosynthesis protein UbiJ